MTRRWLIVGPLLLALACSPATSIQALRRVLTVAQIAVPVILTQTDLSPATRETIVQYLGSVAEATRQASVIILESGTDAEKGARVAAVYAGALAPVLPPGTPQMVVGLVLRMSDAVASFLSHYGSWNMKSGLTATTTPLSNRDRDELVKILQSAGELKAAIRQAAK